MTSDQLRNSILQEAISGRLVPQDPNDEPAAIVSTVPEDEIPFEIPASWRWIRMKDCAAIIGGYAFPSASIKGEKGVRVIRISDISEKGFVNKSVVRYNGHENLDKFKIIPQDILIAMTGGTVGKSLFVQQMGEDMLLNQRVAIIRNNGQFAPYIDIVVKSPHIKSFINDKKNSTNDNISMGDINSFLVPLPPLAEQKRIVAKLEELLPIVEQYGKAQKELDELNAALPARLRQSILQEAISGRLVPQDPNDEPASALLARIREEKARLVKEGTIKAKEVLEYTIDDIPYELPDNWSWVKLGEISYPIKRGKSPVYVENSQYIAFAQKCNAKKGYIDLGLAKYIESKKAETQADIYLKLGDIVINSTGTGTLGRVGLFNVEYPENIIGVVPDSHVATVRLLSIYPEYAYYFLRTCQAYLESLGEGGTNQKELKPSSIAELLFPLPPLAEQQRIVAKIEELFEQIDQIKK